MEPSSPRNLTQPSLFASSPMGEQELEKLEGLGPKVKDFVVSINENLQTNFLLRRFIRDDIKDLTLSEFKDWVNSYDWEVLKKCMLPPSISQAFKMLKKCMFPSEEFLEKFKVCHKKISQAKEVVSCLGKPSKRFKLTVKKILEEKEVRILEEEQLDIKISNLFNLLKTVEDIFLSEQKVETTLISLFGNSFNKLSDYVRDLKEHNPFMSSLVERLLHSPEKLIRKILNLDMEYDSLSLRMLDISKDGNLITIIGEDKTKIILTINEEGDHIGRITWEKREKDCLEKFLPDEKNTEMKSCSIYASPEALLQGFYDIKFESGKERSYLQTWSYRQYGFVPFVHESKETPSDDDPDWHILDQDVVRKEIICRIYEGENHRRWYFFEKDHEEQKICITGSWEDFCKMCQGEYSRTIINRNFDEKFHENRLYTTQTEPVSNDNIRKRLQQEIRAKTDLIECLAEENFDEIFATIFSGNDSLPLIEKLMEKSAISTPLQILCDLREITSKSELLLNFIQKANFLQLRGKNEGARAFVLGDYLHLIDLLNQALEKAEALKGKRGISFIGATGSGKSSTVAYLIGVLMQIQGNRYGEDYVDAKEESLGQGSQPKIGHALGVSETIFTAPFALKNIQAAVSSESRLQKAIKIDAPVNIIRNLVLLDNPGYFDTRGTEYEIATNFSVDYSVDALDVVDAVVQVINYGVFLHERSSPFMRELEELICRYPSVLVDKHLMEKVFFVITKQGKVTLENLQERIQQLLKEERERTISDQSTGHSKKIEGPDKCKLLQFFLDRSRNKGVILLKPNTENQRIDFLNDVLKNVEEEDAQEVSLKSSYVPSLSKPSMLRKFSEIVHGAVSQWRATLDAFDALLVKMKSIEADLHANQEEIARKKQEIEDREKRLKEQEELIIEFEEIEKYDKLQDPSQLSEELQTKIKNAQESQISQTKIAIEQLKKEHSGLDLLIEKINKEIGILNVKKGDLQEEINQETISLKNYSTGVSSQNLVDISYGASSTYDVTVWKNISAEQLQAKTRRAVDRGDEYLSDSESYEREVKTRDMTHVGNTYPLRNISREYPLIPNTTDYSAQLQKLQAISDGAGKTVTFNHSDYSIIIEKNKVDFINIKPHNDGRTISYGFKEKFDGKAPYPKLLITHNVPKKELYKTQIASCTDKINALTGKLSDITKKIEQLESEKKGHLEEQNQKCTQHKKMEVALEQQKVEIIEKIKQCKETCVELKNEMKTFEKEIEALKIVEGDIQAEKEKKLFERKRWALFIDSYRVQLDHTLGMVRYFVKNQAKFSKEIESFNKQAGEVVDECNVFLDDYQKNEQAINEDISQLLSRKDNKVYI